MIILNEIDEGFLLFILGFDLFELLLLFNCIKILKMENFLGQKRMISEEVLLARLI
jgi:hypothetical protein